MNFRARHLHTQEAATEILFVMRNIINKYVENGFLMDINLDLEIILSESDSPEVNEFNELHFEFALLINDEYSSPRFDQLNLIARPPNLPRATCPRCKGRGSV